MKRIIAIDPSSKCLWAVYPVYTRLMYIGLPTDPLNMDLWLRQMRWLQYTTVVYEDCYLSKNAKTYSGLVALRERVREAAHKNKMAFVTVSPSEWQSVMLLCKGEPKRNTLREERKKRSLVMAKYILDYDPPSSDIADAACLWYYYTQSVPMTFDKLNAFNIAPSLRSDGAVSNPHQVRQPHTPQPLHDTAPSRKKIKDAKHGGELKYRQR